MTFTPEVYAVIREGAQRSAAAVAPLVYDIVAPLSVVDVGGGEGWWGREFFRLGCRDVLVIDESVSEPGETERDGSRSFRTRNADLTCPPVVGEYDLALCLEVAEHLEERHAAQLVGWLCGLAPVVLFSAAVPGQGGHGHLNEQWPRYWDDLFTQQGFEVSGGLRWRIWDDDRVEPWYRQNLLIACHRDRCPQDVRNVVFGEFFGDSSLVEPFAVVHPRFYEARCGDIAALRLNG